MTILHECSAKGLGAWDQVNCYCERAGDPGFWAEPLNALSNLAFLFAAVLAYADLRALQRAQGGTGFPLLLIALMALVGMGSFLFHTHATVWARMADVVPIGLFIAIYIFGAYRRLLGLGGLASAVVALIVVATTFSMPPLFNGSLGYVPALLALAITTVLLKARQHPASGWLFLSGAVFAVSLTLRTIDRSTLVCGEHAIGSHWAWHLLNAGVLYMLVRAVLRGDADGRAGKPSPSPSTR